MKEFSPDWLRNPPGLLPTSAKRFSLRHATGSRFRFLILACIFATLKSTPAFSQPLIEELQRLDFGILAVSDNSSVSRFTLPKTGSIRRIEGQFALISAGSPGRFRFTNFPPRTILTVSLNTTSLTTGVNNFPEPFIVDAFDFDDITTDANGEAELSLGARLNTSGSGGAYVDAPYSGITTLRVEYWQPEANAYAFSSTGIEIDTELRSTVSLIEEQSLNFGTLYVRTSTTEQASLILSPDGAYTVDEPSDTRLVVLARPNQAIIRVAGAAPFYQLTLTPQTTDVFLEHTEFPELAPYFVLNPIVTSPASSATTDRNGELLIEIGGTLKTEITATPVVYPSGEYEGTYEFTVSY